MKQYGLLAFLVLYVFGSHAQNVGIGTPTPSARLTVSSSSSLSIPTLELRDQGLSGTPRLKLSNAGGDFGWYMTGIIDNTVNGMENSFLNISYNNDALPVFVVRGNGNVGVGTFIPQYKLDIFGDMNIVGAMRMNGNTGTPGQVLVSNGSSTPSWQSLPATPTPTGFSARLTGNIVLTNTIPAPLMSFVEFFDDGNAFNHSTGEFTAPTAGLYHFDVTILNLPIVTASDIVFTLRYTVNGWFLAASQLQTILRANSNYGDGLSYSFNVKLAANDILRLSAVQVSGGPNVTISGGNAVGTTVFSGYKVY